MIRRSVLLTVLLVVLLTAVTVAGCSREQTQDPDSLIESMKGLDEATGETLTSGSQKTQDTTVVQNRLGTPVVQAEGTPGGPTSVSVEATVASVPNRPVVALSPTPIPSPTETPATQIIPTPQRAVVNPTATPAPGTVIVQPLGGIHRDAANASLCWTRVEEIHERLKCYLVDTSVTESLAQLNQVSITEEPAGLVPFELDKDEIPEVIVGTTIELPDTYMREDYDLHKLRQFNSFITLQSDVIHVPFPPTFETDSWDKFLSLLEQGKLIQPDDVIIEEWVNALPYNYLSPKHINGDTYYRFPLYSGSEQPYEIYNSFRLENPHVDLHVDMAASPFSDERNRFIMRVSAVHADPPVGRDSDLVILFDKSASMNEGSRILLGKEVAAIIAHHYEYESFDGKVALLSYSDGVEEFVNFDNYEFYPNISDGLERIFPSGHGTPTEAIRWAYENIAGQSPIDVVLITDGLDGVSSNEYEGLSELLSSQVEEGNTFNIIDVNTSASVPNYALFNLANAGEGVYHHVTDLDDIRVFMDYKLRMLANNSLRDLGIVMLFRSELVESVRLIGYEDYEPSVGLNVHSGGFGFEGKRVAMFDIYLKDTADFDPSKFDRRTLFINHMFDSVLTRSAKVIANGYTISYMPFTREQKVFKQRFRERDILNYSPNQSLVPYIMVAGLGEIMRQSPWACDSNDYMSIQSLIDYGEGARSDQVLLHEIEDVLRRVQVLALKENIDLCNR